MKYSSLIKTISFSMVFLIAPITYAQAPVSNGNNTECSALKYYGTHIATAGVAQIAFVTSAVMGYLAGVIAEELHVPTVIGRSLGITPDNMLCENRSILAATLFVPFLAGIMTGGYVVYKTPQWTDTYLLNSDEKRTRLQNILTFINRICVPYPFGVVTGEWCSMRVAESENQH